MRFLCQHVTRAGTICCKRPSYFKASGDRYELFCFEHLRGSGYTKITQAIFEERFKPIVSDMGLQSITRYLKFL